MKSAGNNVESLKRMLENNNPKKNLQLCQKALAEIIPLENNGQNSGTVTCPACGKNQLFFQVNAAGQIWMKCRDTEECGFTSIHKL